MINKKRKYQNVKETKPIIFEPDLKENCEVLPEKTIIFNQNISNMTFSAEKTTPFQDTLSVSRSGKSGKK